MDVVAIAMRVGPIAPIHFGLNVRSRIDLDDKIDGHCFVIDEQIVQAQAAALERSSLFERKPTDKH